MPVIHLSVPESISAGLNVAGLLNLMVTLNEDRALAAPETPRRSISDSWAEEPFVVCAGVWISEENSDNITVKAADAFRSIWLVDVTLSLLDEVAGGIV
mmetsp:Transcript_27078/g.47130  ORF Transcript_27078/g.47130 Transcript_27078/m.47130 type:complete len:99 (+) Transcript_27078:383-679(+)